MCNRPNEADSRCLRLALVATRSTLCRLCLFLLPYTALCFDVHANHCALLSATRTHSHLTHLDISSARSLALRPRSALLSSAASRP